MTQTPINQTLASDRPEGLEELIEIGNQLHNQSIFDCFVGWVPAAIRSIAKASTSNPAGSGGQVAATDCP